MSEKKIGKANIQSVISTDFHSGMIEIEIRWSLFLEILNGILVD
jgi:hypothetical protein